MANWVPRRQPVHSRKSTATRLLNSTSMIMWMAQLLNLYSPMRTWPRL